MVVLKSPQEIERMRVAGRIVAEVLLLVAERVKPGVTTLELNCLAEKEAAKRNARPAFKGYCGYPFSLCCSVNQEVVHGMPRSVPLAEGDIVSLDFGVEREGFFGDAAVTIPVGEISSIAARLVEATRESLCVAIEAVQVGHRVSDISHAVQSYIEPRGFSVVREFVGHGIGKELHESPQVPNFGLPGRGVKLRPGMVLAIEPMINEGGSEVKVLADGWTAVTVDDRLSAHFEHTVALTEHGPEILTTV